MLGIYRKVLLKGSVPTEGALLYCLNLSGILWKRVLAIFIKDPFAVRNMEDHGLFYGLREAEERSSLFHTAGRFHSCIL